MSWHLVKKFSFYSLFFILVVSFFWWSVGLIFAQTIEETCANPRDDKEEALCKELKRLEEEERQVQATLNNQKAQSASIQTELNILSSQIRQAQLNIEQKNLAIQQIGSDIALKDQTVKQLNEKLERSKSALAQLLKKTNQLEDISLLEIILAEDNISDFFVNLDDYNRLQNSLDDLFDEIRDIRGLTEEEKEKLEQKQNEERDVKAEIEYQKRKVEVKEGEQENLLFVSKQQEASIEVVLAEKQEKAAQIRSALFQLRDTEGISFGQALKYAEQAEKITGVRPALILGILQQESDLGKNVGRCNLSGDTESKKWNSIMPGPIHYSNYLANGSSCIGAASPCSWRDDQTIFKDIVKRLGRGVDGTPLSCPIASVGGWGGAMGPSQFIPTTWKSYESKIADALKIKNPDPWNPEHAFIATALYMRDLGAAVGGYTAEKTAAAKYYAGNNYLSSYGQSYGNSVMSHATTFQEQIDFLEDIN
jgi:peptidoglycan hydrolase CwlO-like protein